jgi:hypothetical protein
MSTPTVIGNRVVLARGVQVAPFLQGLWHAYRVGMFDFRVSEQAETTVTLTYRGGRFRVEVKESGEVSLAGIAGTRISPELVKEAAKWADRARGFSALYAGGPASDGHAGMVAGSVTFRGTW